MTNRYELEVRAICPIHADLIDVYRVTVRSSALIQVETILECFKKYETQQIFQEVMTREAAVKLGAEVETVGIHAGVTVICRAP